MKAERERTYSWLCAWTHLSEAYTESLGGVDTSSPASKRLPELHGNRRVRTPMYGGERVGWWRQTVIMNVTAANGMCGIQTDASCPHRRWPEGTRRAGGGGAHPLEDSRSVVDKARRAQKMMKLLPRFPYHKSARAPASALGLLGARTAPASPDCDDR